MCLPVGCPVTSATPGCERNAGVYPKSSVKQAETRSPPCSYRLLSFYNANCGYGASLHVSAGTFGHHPSAAAGLLIQMQITGMLRADSS